MNSQEFVLFALQITTMLATALLLGQLMRKFRQPAVLGEMIGGILLGPTVFGLLAPSFYFWLFQSSDNVAVARDASIKLGMLFFMFIVGLETNLTDLKVVGKRAVLIGLIGTLTPIAVGIALVYLLPKSFWGEFAQENFFSFALFIGMNLANSANPVIARILMDLGLLKGSIGTTIMAATVVDDLINWTLFAIILNDFLPAGQPAEPGLPGGIGLVIVLFVVILGFGRWLGPRSLRWVRSHVSWPSGFITLTALLILLAGGASEGLGIHAFLGAFLIGIALGGNDKEHQEAHDVIARFVLSFFAPIYFVSMGMMTNFANNFDFALVLIITVVAYVSKIGSVLLGARIGGMKIDRDVWAISFGLNARGATGIILAGVGLTHGVIDERIFVAIVVMCLITSLFAGPAMNVLFSYRRAAIAPVVRETSSDL